MVNKSPLLLAILLLTLLSTSKYSLGQTSSEDGDATDAQSNAGTDTPSDIDNVLFQDFSAQFHDDEYNTFMFENHKQVYFVMDSNIAFRRGTIILLPDTYGKNVHPSYAKPLANELANAGWQVIMSFLPKNTYETEEQTENNVDSSVNSTESDTADSTNNQQASNMDKTNENESLSASINPMSGASNFTQAQSTSCAKKSKQFVSSLLSKAKNLGARRVIAAQGISAYCLLKGDFSDANGLVLMSPYAPNRELNNELPNLIASSGLPVLDLVSNWDSRWSLATKAQRKISAIRQIKTHYRQRTIVGTPLSPIQSQYLSKEIYGWLSYLGY